MKEFLLPFFRGVFVKLALGCLIIAFFALSGDASAFAQTEPSEHVQVLRGSIFESDETAIYQLSSLHQGDKLYVHVRGISANLDPFAGLLSTDQLTALRRDDFNKAVQLAIENDRDPLLTISEFADQNFLAWDDDSGSGFSAAIEYSIPADGNYFLAVLSSPFTQSFGDYQLTVGLNATEALSGNAVNRGDAFVVSVSRTDSRNAAVQEITAAVSESTPEQRHRLIPFQADDTLYAYVETTSGDLIPQMVLRAYGTKPVRSANIDGNEKQASFDYTFPAETRAYLIEVIATPGTSGSYKLVVGRNDPTVLVGEAAPYGERLLQAPIDASIGVKLQQIANIDQKAENYSAVAATMITWNDPALAFRVDECQCENKVYTAGDFIDFTTQNSIQWPVFTYLNQQNNRWIQNDYVVVDPNGDATYFERFTTTFQAPDFDFRKFPFDTQTFYIRVDSLYSIDFVKFISSDFSEVGTQLGEEEWYVIDHETEVITEPGSTGREISSFIFRFFANRHLSFYIIRIFVPLILILAVTWITFFMADFGKRVDATTANLLLFIAFNFTIAGELPHLGYLTYMDTLLVGAFFISVVVVIYNVYLKRQERLERETGVLKFDRYMIWLYPLGYLIAFLVITWYFFWR